MANATKNASVKKHKKSSPKKGPAKNAGSKSKSSNKIRKAKESHSGFGSDQVG